MNSTYVQRLQEAMEAKQPPADRKALAEAMGITVQALGNILRGEVRKINYTQAAKAARFLGVDLGWLTGEQAAQVSAASGLLAESDGSILLPEPPMRPVGHYGIGRMSMLDYNRTMAQFRRALPLEYREYCGVEVAAPSNIRKVYYDYLSPYLAAMVIPVQGITTGKPPTDAVFEMVIARHGETSTHAMALIFIASDDRFPGSLSAPAEEACAMWGIGQYIAKTPEAAAKVICDLETELRAYASTP